MPCWRVGQLRQPERPASRHACLFLSGTDKPQVINPVSERLATTLKTGRNPVFRAGGKGPGAGHVAQAGSCLQHLQHLPGIVFPVGGQLEFSSRSQTLDQQAGQAWLDQAALVVPFFGPRIGELDHHEPERSPRHGFQPGNHIVVQDLEILEAGVFRPEQQGADAGPVYLGADAAPVGVGGREMGQMLAIPEAYFEQEGPSVFPGKRFRGCGIQQEGRPFFLEDPFLGGGQASLAQDETAYRTVKGIRLEGLLHGGHYKQFAGKS